MKLITVFLWGFVFVRCNENGETKKMSLLETHALPRIASEVSILENYAEIRKNFSLRLIPYFEEHAAALTPTRYTFFLLDVLGGESAVGLETPDHLSKALDEIWSKPVDPSSFRIQQFEQCINTAMDPLKTEQIRKWAENLIDKNDEQIGLAMDALRRAVTSVESDIVMIKAVNAECAARALLSMEYYSNSSDHSLCHLHSGDCSQKCYYVENTPFCTRSWALQSISSREISAALADFLSSYTDDDSLSYTNDKSDYFADREPVKPPTPEHYLSYVSENSIHAHHDSLELVASFYFSLRNNITEVWEAVENQRKVVEYVRDGYPDEDPSEERIDLMTLPEISEHDRDMANLFLECVVDKKTLNNQEYFYNRLHCKDSKYVSGMLLVGNLVDDLNIARITLQCYSDVEDRLVNRYSSDLTEDDLINSIRGIYDREEDESRFA